LLELFTFYTKVATLFLQNQLANGKSLPVWQIKSFLARADGV